MNNHFVKTACVFVAFVAVVLFSGPAWAGDTDPSGVKLRSTVEEYLKNAPANDEKASKIKASGGVDGAANSTGLVELICGVEMASVVGLVIWENRLKDDTCGDKFGGLTSYTYCVAYTHHCEHFVWSPSCLEDKGCPTH
jgi:hypothetical protein